MLRLLNVDPGVGLSDAEVSEVCSPGTLSALSLLQSASAADYRHGQSMAATSSQLKKVLSEFRPSGQLPAIFSFIHPLCLYNPFVFTCPCPPAASAGTPFWKLVLKQFDDLLVKVRQSSIGLN